MVNVEIAYTFQVGFGTGINYDFVETENSIILETGVNRTVTHGHLRNAANQIGQTTVTASGFLNAITSGFFEVRVQIKIHGVTVITKTINISSIGNFFVSVTNIIGTPQAEFTYLEKLDSMDQFTKSQYTPRRRR